MSNVLSLPRSVKSSGCELSDQRLTMLGNGYRPVPVLGDHVDSKSRGKGVILPRWQEVCATADEAAVRGWASCLETSTNTGILLGNIVALDVDVPHKEIAAEVLGVINAAIGRVDMLRFGNPPKFMTPCRAELPFRKMKTDDFYLTDGTKLCFEVLGEGQQVVAFGIHPVTMQPYEWYEDRSPLNVSASGLPLITKEQCRELLAKADAIFRKYGATTKAETRKRNSEGKKAAGLKGAKKPSAGLVQEVLEFVAADLPYDDWLRVGAGIFDALGEDGKTLWQSFSAKSSKNNSEYTDKKWEECKKLNEISVGTLFYYAKEGGWVPKLNDPELHAINEKHFYVFEGRNGFIVEEYSDPVKNRRMLRWISPHAFREKYSNAKISVIVNGKTREVPLGATWVQWPDRRTYDAVVFAPGQELPDSVYNTWRGFAVEPKAGTCESFLDFIQKVICSGNQTDFEYLIGWMARTVQNPSAPGEVAVILRGRKGTGKSFLGEHFGKLFGEHFVQLDQSRHLVGNFNSHMENAVFVLAEEAFWAGDKQAEGTIKNLITGTSILVEKKGIDCRLSDNHVHLMMSSNEDWVIPATADERQFFVLDVSEIHMQDDIYFADLDHKWKSGEREAFMHYIFNYDLSKFNVRKVPTTDGLLDQKLFTLQTVDRWYYEMLLAGENRDAEALSSWAEWVPTKSLYKSYGEYCKTQPTKPVNLFRFGVRIGRLLPPRLDNRSFHTQRKSDGTPRTWGYEFASLEVCRAHFEAQIGGKIMWNQDTGQEDPLRWGY